MNVDVENLAGLDNAPQAGELKPTSVPTDDKQGQKKQWNNNNRPQVDLWNDVNIDPIKFEFLKMVTDNTVKTFSIGYNARVADTIPEDKIKVLRVTMKVLLEKGYRFRSWLGLDKVAEELSKELESKPTMVDYFMLTKKHNPAIQAPVSFTNKLMGFQLAKGVLKAYDKVPGVIRAITARDIEVCLGGDFNKPLNCLIIYIKGGHERLNKDYTTMREDGNMSTLIRMATDLQIPVFNIDTPSFGERFKQFLETGKYISHYQYENKKGKYDYKLNVDKPEVIGGIEETNADVVDGVTKKEMQIQVPTPVINTTTSPTTEPVQEVQVTEPNPVPVETQVPTDIPVVAEEAKSAQPGDLSNLEEIGIPL